MRNPERIHGTLKAVEGLWQKHPDLRLGQLMEWLKSEVDKAEGADFFYIEDDKLVKAIWEVQMRDGKV